MSVFEYISINKGRQIFTDFKFVILISKNKFNRVIVS